MISEIRNATKRSMPYLAGDVLGATALVAMFLTALHSASFF